MQHALIKDILYHAENYSTDIKSYVVVYYIVYVYIIMEHLGA